MPDPGGSEKLNGLKAGLYGGIRPLPLGSGEKSKEAGVDTADTGDEELIDELNWGCKLGPDVTIRMAGGAGRDRSSTGGPLVSRSMLGQF